MSATINIDLPADVFTNITSTLTQDVVHVVQNRGMFKEKIPPIEIIERASAPVEGDIGKGFLLEAKEEVPITRVTGFEIFARPLAFNSSVTITESV